MSRNKLILTLALAAFLAPSVALADDPHRATVLLRNGERVAGLLEDVEGGVVYVRVSQNNQRKLAIGEVALIDFVGGASGLPETEISAARGGNHLALLRGGQSLSGQFVDIRGGEAGAAGETHTLVFRLANGEERRIGLDGVSRIYLGNFPGGTTAAIPAPAAQPQPTYTTSDPLVGGAVRVPANATWVPTALTVRKGDQVRFVATGRIQLSDDVEDVAHPAGSQRQRYAAGSPLPQNFAGALIAKIGNTLFPIGDNTAAVVMPADGQLMLGINDDELRDNRGEYTVVVTPMRRR